MGRLHALSCQPSSKLPSRYRHRTPAPAGLGDAARSILTEVSSGPEMVRENDCHPRAEGTTYPWLALGVLRLAPALRRKRGSSSAWGQEQGHDGS